MKIELDGKFNTSLIDFVDAVLVARLKQSVTAWEKLKHPDDRAYYEKYNAAAKFVIEHFGGHHIEP